MVRRRLVPGVMTGCRVPCRIQVERSQGQLVDVGLVLGQHHRAVGQLAKLLVQRRQGLFATGIADLQRMRLGRSRRRFGLSVATA
jgi:hypothetical protein